MHNLASLPVRSVSLCAAGFFFSSFASINLSSCNRKLSWVTYSTTSQQQSSICVKLATISSPGRGLWVGAIEGLDRWCLGFDMSVFYCCYRSCRLFFLDVIWCALLLDWSSALWSSDWCLFGVQVLGSWCLVMVFGIGDRAQRWWKMEGARDAPIGHSRRKVGRKCWWKLRNRSVTIWSSCGDRGEHSIWSSSIALDSGDDNSRRRWEECGLGIISLLWTLVVETGHYYCIWRGLTRLYYYNIFENSIIKIQLCRMVTTVTPASLMATMRMKG